MSFYTAKPGAWPEDRETRLHELATLWSLEVEQVLRWLTRRTPGEPSPGGAILGKTFVWVVLGRYKRYTDICMSLDEAFKGREHVERLLLDQLLEVAR